MRKNKLLVDLKYVPKIVINNVIREIVMII